MQEYFIEDWFADEVEWERLFYVLTWIIKKGKLC